MTKVEELRATLKKVLAVVHDEQVVSAIEDVVDSLIAAARAEGAEEERERIRKAGVPVSNVTFSPDGRVMSLGSDGRDQMPSYFVPASLLAPAPKEEGK